jgi:hypothetical protein
VCVCTFRVCVYLTTYQGKGCAVNFHQYPNGGCVCLSCVCVCVCVCVHVQTNGCIHTAIRGSHTYIYSYIHTYIHTCTDEGLHPDCYKGRMSALPPEGTGELLHFSDVDMSATQHGNMTLVLTVGMDKVCVMCMYGCTCMWKYDTGSDCGHGQGMYMYMYVCLYMRATQYGNMTLVLAVGMD